MFEVDCSDQRESKASHQSMQSPGGVCLPGPYVSHCSVYLTTPDVCNTETKRVH